AAAERVLGGPIGKGATRDRSDIVERPTRAGRRSPYADLVQGPAVLARQKPNGAVRGDAWGAAGDVDVAGRLEGASCAARPSRAATLKHDRSRGCRALRLWGPGHLVSGNAVRVCVGAVDCDHVTRGSEISAGRRVRGYQPQGARMLHRGRATAPTAGSGCTADRGVAHGLDSARDLVAGNGGPRKAHARGDQRDLLVTRGRRVVGIRPVGISTPRSGHLERSCDLSGRAT